MADIDIERFSPTPDPELICPICHSVIHQPYETPCQHVFCKDCINEWIRRGRGAFADHGNKCPSCRDYVYQDELKPALTILCNLINKLKVKCINHSAGCSEVIAKEYLERHEKGCDYQEVQCDNSGCAATMLKKELQKHAESCAMRIVQCSKDCQLRMPFYRLKRHSCMDELKQELKERYLEVAVMREIIGTNAVRPNATNLRSEINWMSGEISFNRAMTLSNYREVNQTLRTQERDLLDKLVSGNQVQETPAADNNENDESDGHQTPTRSESNGSSPSHSLSSSQGDSSPGGGDNNDPYDYYGIDHDSNFNYVSDNNDDGSGVNSSGEEADVDVENNSDVEFMSEDEEDQNQNDARSNDDQSEYDEDDNDNDENSYQNDDNGDDSDDNGDDCNNDHDDDHQSDDPGSDNDDNSNEEGHGDSFNDDNEYYSNDDNNDNEDQGSDAFSPDDNSDYSDNTSPGCSDGDNGTKSSSNSSHSPPDSDLDSIVNDEVGDSILNISIEDNWSEANDHELSVYSSDSEKSSYRSAFSTRREQANSNDRIDSDDDSYVQHSLNGDGSFAHDEDSRNDSLVSNHGSSVRDSDDNSSDSRHSLCSPEHEENIANKQEDLTDSINISSDEEGERTSEGRSCGENLKQRNSRTLSTETLSESSVIQVSDGEDQVAVPEVKDTVVKTETIQTPPHNNVLLISDSSDCESNDDHPHRTSTRHKNTNFNSESPSPGNKVEKGVELTLESPGNSIAEPSSNANTIKIEIVEDNSYIISVDAETQVPYERCSEGSFEPDYTESESESEDVRISKRGKTRKNSQGSRDRNRDSKSHSSKRGSFSHSSHSSHSRKQIKTESCCRSSSVVVAASSKVLSRKNSQCSDDRTHSVCSSNRQPKDIASQTKRTAGVKRALSSPPLVGESKRKRVTVSK